jgi:hypothetical protein
MRAFTIDDFYRERVRVSPGSTCFDFCRSRMKVIYRCIKRCRATQPLVVSADDLVFLFVVSKLQQTILLTKMQRYRVKVFFCS